MSVVSGITLQISVAEDYIEQDGDKDDIFPLIERINAWLSKRNFGPLAAVEKFFGGSKHPQVSVYGAGFNYFPETELEALILSLPWRVPETVVLLINPEDGPTRVVRPNF